MKHTLHFAAITVALLTAGSAMAADSVLSPKAQALSDSFRKVGAGSTETIDRSIIVGSPRSNALSDSFRKVAGNGSGVDLAHGATPTMSPKDPNYSATVQDMRSKEFHVAPLK